MPEVNEVRKYADFINSKIKRKTITNINILKGRYKTHQPFENYELLKKNLPLRLLEVKTKGKFIYFHFDNDLYLFNTLGLTGGWCFIHKNNSFEYSDNLKDYSPYFTKDEIQKYIEYVHNHLNVEFVTSKGSLYFYDMLSFGSLKVVKGKEELIKKLKQLGPDIMDTETTFNIFEKQIRKSKNNEKEIGIVLMDQTILSGIGNHLRSDILYASRISPFSLTKYLTKEHLETIYKNSKLLSWAYYDMKQAKKMKLINRKTILPFDYNRLFFVYSETEDIYGNSIQKEELYAGSEKRYIYYVPALQPLINSSS